MKTWYAVYTKRNCERKLFQRLKKCNIDCIFFLNHICITGKFFKEPLFPSYVFVHTTNSELKKNQQLSEIINPVYWQNTPITFTDQEMEDMKTFTKNNFNIETSNIEITDGLIKDFSEKNIFPNNNYINNTTVTNVYSFQKLGILLKAERLNDPFLKLYKKESYSRILFKMGINFFS